MAAVTVVAYNLLVRRARQALSSQAAPRAESPAGVKAVPEHLIGLLPTAYDPPRVENAPRQRGVTCQGWNVTTLLHLHRPARKEE